jgi:uncharacterized protein (TIGR03083 family)
VASNVEHLDPAPGEQGLASRPVSEFGSLTLAAWDSFLRLAEAVDLDAPSRLPGWRGREILVHLGSWEGHRPFQRLAEAARGGPGPPVLDPDDANARIVAAHADADREQVLGALRTARDAAFDLLASLENDNERLGRLPVDSGLGPLPLLVQVYATTYELAVHALDLVSCGAPEPDPALLDAGLASLVDVTGALAARHGIDASATAMTPAGGWTFASAGGAWRTARTPPGAPSGPGVEADAAVLLDVSAGRRPVPPLILRRDLRLHHVPHLMVLAPIIEQVPGLPGGAALRTAARYVGGVGRLVHRIPGLR